MKLLLDEHFSPQIARELRKRGHDVIAVSEVPDLLGRDDSVHFSLMQRQKRAIVTENVGDFRPLLKQAVKQGAKSYGLILVNPRRFPRSRKTIGLMVKTLALLLEKYPAEDALCDKEFWLIKNH